MLDPEWADVPLALIERPTEMVLVYRDSGEASPLSTSVHVRTIDDFLRAAVGAAQALMAAHAANVIHGSIQPAHLLDDGAGHVRLTGFWYSRTDGASASKATVPDYSLDAEDLPYAAPEQLRRAHPVVDRRSDLYSLGVSLFHLLTGKLPLRGRSTAEWLHAHIAISPKVPGALRPDVPPILDAVLLKLLAKDPADRYGSAASLHADLSRCQLAWEKQRQIPEFPLGMADGLQRAESAPALFGRDVEAQTLTRVIGRVAEGGRAEMVLISGAGGIGKSALFAQSMAEAGGAATVQVACGKCDQSLDERPYGPVLQALRSLIDRVLGESSTPVEALRRRLAQLLEGQGQVIADLLPGFETLAGGSTVMPELAPQLARARLKQAMLRTVASFTDARSPLVLFLDDLQWADPSTLEFLAALANDAPEHLLVVGAYRDDEAERLFEPDGLIERVRAGRMPLTELALEPLTVEAVAALIVQLLPPAGRLDEQIASMIHQRTAGNPFFVHQLLRAMIADGLASFDPAQSGWTWRREAVARYRSADNVVDFMVRRLDCLPVDTREVLRLMALVGREVNAVLIERLAGIVMAEIHNRLQPLIDASLLRQEEMRYVFAHDRVLEAAYSLTSLSDRATEHARIARAMIERQRPAAAETIFEIAGQAERAAGALLSDGDRADFVQALVSAAAAARAAAAPGQAAHYLRVACQFIEPEWWSFRYDVAFRTHLLLAENLLAAFAVEEADAAVEVLLDRAGSALDRAAAYRLRANLLTVQSDYEGAIDAALAGLALLAITLRRGAGRPELDRAYDDVKAALGGRSLSELSDLPSTGDVEVKAAMSLLSTLVSSMFIEDGLRFLHTAKMAELTLLHGATEESSYGLSWFGVMIADLYGDYADGLQYGQAALGLVDRLGYEAQRTGTLVAIDQVSPWTRSLAFALERVRDAIAGGHATGDVAMACYARNHLVSDLIVIGERLPVIEFELAEALTVTRELGYRDIELLLGAQLGLVRSLCEETAAVHHAAEETTGSGSRSMVFWARLYAGMEAFFARDFPLAVRLLDEAEGLSWAVPAHIDSAYCVFFAALSGTQHAGTHASQAVLSRVHAWQQRLAGWSALNPGTFRNKYLLVEAELARIGGDPLGAMTLYERSIRDARDNRFVHEQAIAHELAAEHCQSLGWETAAFEHLRAAHRCYRQWGADTKARQLLDAYPMLATAGSDGVDTTLTAPERTVLDLDPITQASLALSEEIVLDRLIETLMRAMIIHAGADHGHLLLMEGGTPIMRASARVVNGNVVVELGRSRATAAVPSSILNTVLRTRTPLVLADARVDVEGMHAAGSGAEPIRSVLCLPLLKRGDLIGIVYLGNAQATRVFTPDRTAGVEMLASQAAISLDNARLYGELVTENARRAEAEVALRTARAEMARTSHLTVMGSLAASIAHEINQPLSGIASYAAASTRWLGRDAPDVPQALAGLASIQEGAKRAADIIRALRALAKQAPTDLVPLSVDAVIGEVLTLTATEIEAHEVALDRRLGAGETLVMGDRVQLQQVVLNLVTNGIDAMLAVPAAEREMVITSAVTGDDVVVRIEDNGVGLDPQVRARLFDPLFTTKDTGMGMGLAICRSIIEAHGGTLDAHSAGRGSAFEFNLPVSGKNGSTRGK